MIDTHYWAVISEADNPLYRAYLWATVIGVIGGFIGIGLILWQAVITRQAARAAAESARAARASADALINSERAWVHAELVRSKLVSDLWSFSISNYGRTPAEVLCVRAESYCLTSESLSQPDKFRTLTIPKNSLLVSGSPDDSFSFDVKNDYIWKNDWMMAQKDKPESRFLVIEFEVTYRDILDRDRSRHTRVVYRYDIVLSTFTLVPQYTSYA